jgi:predicted dehydrogenase
MMVLKLLKEIRWGIIGCGDVTEVKSGPGFQKAEGSQLVAVMRRNGDLARDYAARHGVPKWYDDADALIHDQEVDAVYIATPPSSHKEYTLAVAAAGKPVYVEKPMALNFGECREMIRACEEASVPLFVAFYRRALPRFKKIKALLEDEVIGKIRFVQVTFYHEPRRIDLEGEKHWRIDPAIAGCGYFCDLASHMLDILQFLLGDINTAQGQTANQLQLYEAEDMVSALFSFSSGVHGSGIWNFNAYENVDRTEIVGEKGKISFATFGDSPVELQDRNGIKQFTLKNPAHIQQPLIQTIVDELRGKGKCPSTGNSAARTNWVMDRILGKTS